MDYAPLLEELLGSARPLLTKEKRLERLKANFNSSPEQVKALRKACLVLQARIVDEPTDSGMLRQQLASFLTDLYAANLGNAGVIADQMSSGGISEEDFFALLDKKLFVNPRRSGRLSNEMNSILEKISNAKLPENQIIKSLENHVEVKMKPVADQKAFNNTDAFITARKLIDNTQLLKKSGGKNMGGKRWAIKEEPDEGQVKTEFGYYNLTKAPTLKPNAPATKIKEPVAVKEDASVIDERLQGIDPKLVEMIRNEIMHRVDSISWDSIAGLEHAKKTIFEIVIWPMLRPDLFNGLRGPPKGLLLFGPPGTGKTMIGKCIASQAKATFFSISASSLTSKWVGESEKMVRALFAVARCHQPAVIFIDEIDSMLCQRSDGEVEASRRLKTEFLVQFDGAATSAEDRILVVGATNRPQELDEAARRRLVKRLYIPLPDAVARKTIILNLLANQKYSLSATEIDSIVALTDGYSGSDMDCLCREAALGPIRAITDILVVNVSEVRDIGKQDFDYAITQVRASVSGRDLEEYLDWNTKYGSLSG